MTVAKVVLTRREAAAYLGVCVSIFDRLRRDGAIAETWLGRAPRAKSGGVLRFKKDVLDRYLDSKTKIAT